MTKGIEERVADSERRLERLREQLERQTQEHKRLLEERRQAREREERRRLLALASEFERALGRRAEPGEAAAAAEMLAKASSGAGYGDE